jgi:uncharacterized protein (TIGR02996 family)
MSSPAPFLAAIASNPDDDLPRLVYADWLDEHDQPDRAEFIRLQCHSARVGPLDPTWAAAKLREYAWFKANESAWRPGQADDISQMLAARWRRGFPQMIDAEDVAGGRFTAGEWCNGAFHLTATTAADRFVAQGRPWPQVGPVRTLNVAGWRPGCGQLLRYEPLLTVRSIMLLEWYAAVRPDGLEDFLTELAALPAGHFPELTSLDLDQGELTLTAVRALAVAPVLAQLTRLSLRLPAVVPVRELDDWEAAAATLFARLGERAAHLELQGMWPELVDLFAAVKWPNLRSLHLWPIHVSEFRGWTAADAPALRTLVVSHLGRLEVQRSWLDGHDLTALARWPALRGVNVLALGAVPAAHMQTFLAAVSAPRFDLFAARVEPDTPTPLRLNQLAAHPCFGGLKAISGAFTNVDLAELSDPQVLPELHTVWSDDTHPAGPLPWAGGTRTVIQKDRRDEWRRRPSRGDWCGWYPELFG